MSRMKFFRNLLLLFIFLFIFVEFMTHQFIKSTYIPIYKEDEAILESPKIEIIDAKSTNMNGYLKAKITNNTDNSIKDKYIKLDFFSKYNNNLGTKYLKINNLNIGETKEFELMHKYQGVKKIVADIVDESPITSETMEFSLNLTKYQKLALLAGGLISLYFMPARYLWGWFPF